MKTQNQMECGCCCGCSLSRRSFLATGAAAGMAGLSQGLFLGSAGANDASAGKKMNIRVIFSLRAPIQPHADWPNIGFDFNPVMEQTMNALRNGCKDLHFIASMADGPEQTKGIVTADASTGNIDGYIVMQMNGWIRVAQPTVESGKPVLFADFLYGGSGGFLVHTAEILRAKKSNFAFISSSRIGDVVAAANCLLLAKGSDDCQAFVDGMAKIRQKCVADVQEDMQCADDKCDVLSTDDLMKELKTKKILAFERDQSNSVKSAKELLGIEILERPFAELHGLWEKADKDQALEIVQRWKKAAAAVVGVSDETLEKSARMHLAMQQCLKDHDACAITINCLGGFENNHLRAYPCLGFHELLNEGRVGACECDTLSTLTMVVMTTLTRGRPGFISDPVMDVATKQIIYAHCVAANKPFGPQGASNPVTIMTHSEDRQGASLRSTLPLGYLTTTLKLDPRRKEIVFHQAKAVANSTEDRACRTKLACVPLGDFEKLFTQWGQWRWHRVTYYGDLKEPVFALAERLGWKVVEEA